MGIMGLSYRVGFGNLEIEQQHYLGHRPLPFHALYSVYGELPQTKRKTSTCFSRVASRATSKNSGKV